MAEEIVYDLTDSRYWICKYLMVDMTVAMTVLLLFPVSASFYIYDFKSNDWTKYVWLHVPKPNKVKNKHDITANFSFSFRFSTFLRNPIHMRSSYVLQ